MIGFLLSVCIAMAAPGELPTVEELIALPPEARIPRLQEAAADGEYTTKAAAQAAEAVLVALAADGRTDLAVMRGFLEAALSGDGALRDRAVADAQAHGLPPAPQVAPAALRPSAPLDLLRRYRDQRLYKAERTMVLGGGTTTAFSVASHTGWTVYRNAAPLTTTQFAKLVGDTEGQLRIKKESDNKVVGAVLVAVAGVALTAGGFALIGDDDDNNDNAGAIVAGLGATGIGVGIALPIVNTRNQAWVASAYDGEEADRWINAYNDRLRAELQLSEDDVRAMEEVGD
jgi:hypothetical protein